MGAGRPSKGGAPGSRRVGQHWSLEGIQVWFQGRSQKGGAAEGLCSLPKATWSIPPPPRQSQAGTRATAGLSPGSWTPPPQDGAVASAPSPAPHHCPGSEGWVCALLPPVSQHALCVLRVLLTRPHRDVFSCEQPTMQIGDSASRFHLALPCLFAQERPLFCPRWTVRVHSWADAPQVRGALGIGISLLPL